MATFENMDFVTYRDKYFNNRTDHQLVDVRSSYEFMQGHVPNAVNIPLDQIGYRMNEIDQERPIVVICATGNRSQMAAQMLKQSGYNRVYNLQGGTMIWMMNGLQLNY
jgi:rhodanese-related sulfurtransferase